jgi:type VI protein secretion system component VasF
MATTVVSPSGTTILASTEAWERFRVTRTAEDRDALVAAFMPLLRAALAMQPPVTGAAALERRTAAAVRAALSAIETYEGQDAAGLRLVVFRTVTRRLERFTGR